MRYEGHHLHKLFTVFRSSFWGINTERLIASSDFAPYPVGKEFCVWMGTKAKKCYTKSKINVRIQANLPISLISNLFLYPGLY